MRALVWRGVEEWLAEHAQVDLLDDGVLATGVQLGVEPEPYRLDYLLDVPSGWITRRVEVEASGAGRRPLALAALRGANCSSREGVPALARVPGPLGWRVGARPAIDCQVCWRESNKVDTRGREERQRARERRARPDRR